ncbi:hypothetical protein AKJ09_07436 [Labilithrix luteola]|uniref:Uncharacterized protein n=2 Tax=Labilithrix luteola TaxID=1391654 RepID=A0A0K1Q4W8_9BACT|nr:hypothetical protein AKJ09_07436 [Labilithrix luteola]
MLSLVFGVSWFVSMLLLVANIIVVATVVRRHRPDVFKSLLAWAITGLVVSGTSPLVNFVAVNIAARSGTSSVIATQLATTLVNIPIHVLVSVLLLRGIIKLAQPPKAVVIESNQPYR